MIITYFFKNFTEITNDIEPCIVFVYR